MSKSKKFSLKITDVINGVMVNNLSLGEREILEKGIQINRTGFDFVCYEEEFED